MIVIFKVMVIAALWFGSIALCAMIEVDPSVPSVLVLFGGISYFLGPYATGSGFFVKWHRVNTATPECVWRICGIILWVIAVICIVYMWEHQPI